MNQRVAAPNSGSPKSRPRAKPSAKQGRIHPVIVYPFRPENNYADLGPLYGLVRTLAEKPQTYRRPITVMDRKTYSRMAPSRAFRKFRDGTVAECSDVLDAWCVDTCQMWYSGLGMAFERGEPEDVYWLIPGDFNYGSPTGKDVLSHLHDLPEICLELGQDVCVGEITTDHGNPKQLIDTYGTFALLYNWFPTEARELRQYTERPRSEFFAIRHGFLKEMLHRRWYAYEQTVVILLHAMSSQKRLSRFRVGNISDLPEGRESFASAVQQVERTERVLKSVWRDRHADQTGWTAEYRALEEQSRQIVRSAFVMLETLLK